MILLANSNISTNNPTTLFFFPVVGYRSSRTFGYSGYGQNVKGVDIMSNSTHVTIKGKGPSVVIAVLLCPSVSHIDPY